jgi:hypothetical protein
MPQPEAAPIAVSKLSPETVKKVREESSVQSMPLAPEAVALNKLDPDWIKVVLL